MVRIAIGCLRPTDTLGECHAAHSMDWHLRRLDTLSYTIISTIEYY